MKQRNHILLSALLGAAFLLGIRDGRLALWQEGSPHPVRTYALHPDCLPQQDLAELQRGIRADTLPELTALLEDFLS